MNVAGLKANKVFLEQYVWKNNYSVLQVHRFRQSIWIQHLSSCFIPFPVSVSTCGIALFLFIHRDDHTVSPACVYNRPTQEMFVISKTQHKTFGLEKLLGGKNYKKWSKEMQKRYVSCVQNHSMFTFRCHRRISKGQPRPAYPKQFFS